MDEDSPVPGPEPTETEAVPRGRRDGRRDLAVEVAVVLAVLWLPYAFAAVAYPEGVPLSFAVDMAYLGVLSVGTSALVLWVIARSGAGWGAFGIRRPSFLDALGGVGLIGLYYGLWSVLPRGEAETDFPEPGTALDLVWLIAGCAAIGFSEELLYRAYLVPRLHRVLGSRTLAVAASAGAFAAAHLYQGSTNAFGHFVWSLAFGGLYLFWRRLWPFALAHAVADVISYVPLE